MTDVLTRQKLLAAYRLIQSIPAVPPPFKIVTTDGGCWIPARRHSKHANGGKASYHQRIQKKWLKRFGLRWQELQPRGQIFKVGSDTLIVRKDDLPELDRLFAAPGNSHEILGEK